MSKSGLTQQTFRCCLATLLSEQASLATVFAVMRLLGQGNDDETIIRQCAVTLQTVEMLKTAVRELSLKLRFGRSRSGGADEGDPALRFLNRLPAVFWRRAFARPMMFRLGWIVFSFLRNGSPIGLRSCFQRKSCGGYLSLKISNSGQRSGCAGFKSDKPHGSTGLGFAIATLQATMG